MLAMTDLSKALGHTFDYEHAEVWKTLDGIVKKANARAITIAANMGYAFTTHEQMVERVKRMHEHGVRICLMQGADSMYENFAKRLLGEMRSAEGRECRPRRIPRPPKRSFPLTADDLRVLRYDQWMTIAQVRPRRACFPAPSSSCRWRPGLLSELSDELRGTSRPRCLTRRSVHAHEMMEALDPVIARGGFRHARRVRALLRGMRRGVGARGALCAPPAVRP